MRRLAWLVLLGSCGISASDVVGHYNLQCDGVYAGWIEITADREIMLDPYNEIRMTEQHVTDGGDAWQVDYTTRTTFGEGGFSVESYHLKFDHNGGTGTSSSYSSIRSTPMTACSSLVATRNTAP